MATVISDTNKRVEKREIRKALKKYGIRHKDVAKRAGLHENRMVELLRVYDPYFNENLVSTAWEMVREAKETEKAAIQKRKA